MSGLQKADSALAEALFRRHLNKRHQGVSDKQKYDVDPENERLKGGRGGRPVRVRVKVRLGLGVGLVLGLGLRLVLGLGLGLGLGLDTRVLRVA